MGELVVQGTPAEVVTKEWMREIFEIDAQIVLLPETNKPVFLSYDLMTNRKEGEKVKQKRKVFYACIVYSSHLHYFCDFFIKWGSVYRLLQSVAGNFSV